MASKEVNIDREIELARLEATRDPVAEKASELGLVQVWAYHCQRCNHVWLPKDFDIGFHISMLKPGQKNIGEDLVFSDREHPKACARCKSKYWNRLPYRRTNYHDGLFHSKRTIPRLRALHRQGKLGYKVDGCDCQYCKP
jgi:hypothetical protein